jgi:hypothetical protein
MLEVISEDNPAQSISLADMALNFRNQTVPERQSNMTAYQEDFEDTLVFQTRRAIDNPQNIKTQFKNKRQLTRPGNHCRYMTANFQGNQLRHLPKHEYPLEIPKQDSLCIQDSHHHVRSIDERLRDAAFHLSDGNLLPKYHQKDIIRLVQWPDFTRRHHSPNAPRIAALPSARPTSAKLAARILHIPQEELYPLYSADCYAGYTRTTNRHCDEIRLKPHRSASIIRKLFDRFSLSHT